MSKQILNNFIYGATDKNILGRTELKAYNQSASIIENFKLNSLGGLSRREGLTEVLRTTTRTRLIAFSYSSDLSFLLIFEDKQLRIINTITHDQIGEPIETEYSAEELAEIQYAQNEDSLFLTHIDHPVYILEYAGDSFAFSKFKANCDDENPHLFEEENDYPSVVALCSNRLYLASSRNKPFTIWVSKSFDPTNFWTYKVGTSTTSRQATTDEYISQFEKWKANELTTVTKTYTTWEIELKQTNWWKERVEVEGGGDASKISIAYTDLLATNTSLFTEVMTIYETEETQVYTDENAMILELASSKNDKITFINILHNIIVGTRSSEWIIPYDITPSSLKATKESSYGSTFLASLNMQTELIFFQNSGVIRSMKYDYANYNYPCEDITIFNKEILEKGIVECATQSVPVAKLFCICKDGTLAVMTRNELDNTFGWVKYKTEIGNFISIAVADVNGEQRVYCVIDNSKISEELTYITCFFDKTKLNDLDEYSFISKFESNPIETTTYQTLDNTKYGWSIGLRVFDTNEFKGGFSNSPLKIADATKTDIVTLPVPTSWSKDLRIKVESIEDNPLNISAILMNIGVV